MAKLTISFTIEEEQLTRVDALAMELDRDRSSTLRQVIEAGIPMLKASRQVYEAMQRAPLPIAAFPGAAPELEGAA